MKFDNSTSKTNFPESTFSVGPIKAWSRLNVKVRKEFDNIVGEDLVFARQLTKVNKHKLESGCDMFSPSSAEQVILS